MMKFFAKEASVSAHNSTNLLLKNLPSFFLTKKMSHSRATLAKIIAVTNIIRRAIGKSLML